MEIEFVRADISRIPDLLELMQEFYTIEHLPYEESVARRGLRELFQMPALGAVHLIETEKHLAGYVVLTFGFSLEFHGRDGLVDELYIREGWRGRGLGRAALAFVEALCQKEGLAAVHLEVDRTNTRAQEVYRKSGYKDHDRFLLTKWL